MKLSNDVVHFLEEKINPDTKNINTVSRYHTKLYKKFIHEGDENNEKIHLKNRKILK